VPDGEGELVWKFSNATIAQLDVLYDTYRYNDLIEWLATELPAVSFLGIELFKWVSVLGAMLAASPFVLLLAWGVAGLLVSPKQPLHSAVRRFLLGPVSAFVLVLLGNQVVATLGIGLTGQKLSQTYTVITFTTIWLLWQGVNLFRASYSQRLIARGRGSSVALLAPLTTSLKLLILLLGVLVWLDNLGFQITAVLTGLGIGGVAVALVLQKPLEDVFGAITLYTQQPIKIGDFGRFGATTGTVEEISLRTTRIRTLANSLVSIPNMRLASEPIENLSAREKFLFSPVLRLEGDSSPEAVEELLGEVRQMLSEHERVLPDGMRVRFTAITLAGFDISVFAYIDAADWADYLAVAEALNFAILRLISAVGLKLTAQGAVLSTLLE
jgi:MscS family membrane protein